jgi:hypothetical protein
MSNSLIQNLPVMYINMHWTPELNRYVPDPNFIPNYLAQIDEYLTSLATEGQMSCVTKEQMNEFAYLALHTTHSYQRCHPSDLDEKNELCTIFQLPASDGSSSEYKITEIMHFDDVPNHPDTRTFEEWMSSSVKVLPEEEREALMRQGLIKRNMQEVLDGTCENTERDNADSTFPRTGWICLP